MVSEKQDNETVISNTEKADNQEETKSNGSDGGDTDSDASSEYEVVSSIEN